MTKVLIFGGKTGWIGQMMHKLCEEQGTLSIVEHFLRYLSAVGAFTANDRERRMTVMTMIKMHSA